MLRSWQPHVSAREMKVGWLDRGIWESFSDLLGDLSALSSYEDALAEAVYEEPDYLMTQKEGLQGSPGGCLCLPSWDSMPLPQTLGLAPTSLHSGHLLLGSQPLPS